MRKTLIVPLIFGIAGVAVLLGLGKWQLDRLAWKEGILADIEARISAAPVALPDEAEPQADRYLPVEVTGRIGARTLRVLVSRKQVGAGYRLISALDTGGRRVLLDRGFVKVAADIPQTSGEVRVTGNLHWPDDRLSSTPENDVAGNTWFARDIAQMAEVLETEPVLVVARDVSPPEQGVTPLPVDTGGIPNDHLSYAITWFSLAVIWAAMTGAFIWRARRAAKGAGQ
ncbi:SURF1 family protein [Roseovarius nitratireducens]|uniref:SURF1 family protein n=1 Tax=Roseovarius nitratireducens TaxID=2044597 RepID=UPI000CE25E73|nr:SURF1 family protein [Roseovarius nitratireducens]